MTTLREAAQQALEALELANVNHWWGSASIEKAITALRAALAQEQAEPVRCPASHVCDCQEAGQPCARAAPKAEPVQEPVAWMYTGVMSNGIEHGPHLIWKPESMDAMSASKGVKATPLYTAPPKAEPLTEELVTWGVDWGRDGDQSCVSIIKKHADGTIEVVAVEYAPAQPPAEPVQEPDSPERRCGGPGCDLKCCQPVREPVAWLWKIKAVDEGPHTQQLYFFSGDDKPWSNGWTWTPLYTAPPKAEPLTDEEIDRIWRDGGWAGRPSIGLIRAIERALEKKNGR